MYPDIEPYSTVSFPSVMGTPSIGNGAADDCNVPPKCPGGIRNEVFAITANVAPLPTSNPIFADLDGSGNFAVVASLSVSAALIAGAGVGTPAPLPAYTPGSLVSFGGISPARGDLLLGSKNQYAKCDYGETTHLALTCNQSFIVSNGGVRASNIGGGYVPQVLPNGVATPNPRILSGTCSVSGSTVCAFPNAFGFSDTSYNCSVSAQGTTPSNASYSKSSASAITINSNLGGTVIFSYICTG